MIVSVLPSVQSCICTKIKGDNISYLVINNRGQMHDCFSNAICTKIKEDNVSYLVISLPNKGRCFIVRWGWSGM